jgi:hypothetical protein
MTRAAPGAEQDWPSPDWDQVPLSGPADDPDPEDDGADDWPTDPLPMPFDPDPEAVRGRCLAALAAWPVRAIGGRPADWLAHDLLLYGLLRDARLPRFHRMWQAPEEWMADRVGHLPPGAARRALQLAALHYGHLWQLDRARDFLACADADMDGGAGLRRWQRLWHCRPYGAAYAGPDGPQRCCGLLHLCPWCRARAGVRLWQRLRGRVGDRPLFLLRCTTTSHGVEVLAQRLADGPPGPARCQAPGSLWWLPPELRAGHLYGDPDRWPREFRYARPRQVRDPRYPLPMLIEDPYALLSDATVRAARAQLRRYLGYWARRLGVAHGLTVFAIEPDLSLRGGGNLPFAQFRFWGFVLAEPPEGPDPDPGLRHFLEHDGGLLPHGAEYPYLTVGGLRGRDSRPLACALGYPALLLLPPDQWPAYCRNTGGLPLFRAFGTWRRVLAGEDERAPEPPAPPSPGRRALDAHNHRKQAAALEEHARLLPLARALWPRVLEEAATGRRGRPAHRRRLGQLLAAQGEAVSRRQLEALVAHLTGRAP